MSDRAPPAAHCRTRMAVRVGLRRVSPAPVLGWAHPPHHPNPPPGPEGLGSGRRRCASSPPLRCTCLWWTRPTLPGGASPGLAPVLIRVVGSTPRSQPRAFALPIVGVFQRPRLICHLYLHDSTTLSTDELGIIDCTLSKRNCENHSGITYIF